MKYLAVVSLLTLLFSCAKTTEDITITNDLPVVSSFISPTSTPSVLISKLVLFENDISDTVNNIDGLEVYLSDIDAKYKMTSDPNKSGRYNYTDSVFIVEVGEEYYLEFMYKDILVSSHTKVPAKPENYEASATVVRLVRITEGSTGGGPGQNVGNLDLTWDNPDDGYYLVRYEYLESTYDPVNENIEIDNPAEVASVTSTPIQDSMYSIRANKFQFFGHYHLILYKITEDYAAIYESLNQSSLDDLSEPITNINNGKGIFASFNSDTLLVNVIPD